MSYFVKDNKGHNIKNVLHLSKEISYLKLFFYNISRFDFFKYNTGYCKNKIASILFTLYFLINKKFLVLSEKKSNDGILNLLIIFEKNIQNIFIRNNLVQKIHFRFYENYIYQRNKRKREYYGWGLYTIAESIIAQTYYIFQNITLFILYYINLFLHIILWLLATIIFLILFWKFLHFFKYLSSRYISFKSRNKSIIVVENNEQSQSLIIKGD